MTRRILPFLGLLILSVVLAATSDDVQGCAPVPREGQRVDVADETAFIIWDDVAHKEHFIRRATFTGNADDFGFLVPTPSKPEIALADDDIYAELSRITAPVVEHRTVNDWSLGCFTTPATDKSAIAEPTPGVIVLEQKRVGNLNYDILMFRGDKTQRPEDAADELIAWLKRNGYAVRPDLAAWLVPYIHNQWIITGFKIASPASNGPAQQKAEAKGISLKSTTVRMSFDTFRPYFPYREPEYQREGSENRPRSLRVFVAAKQRMAGKIGDGSIAWPGRTVWANAITPAERITLLERGGKLSLDTMPGKWWITEFEDLSSPRPGYDELYFTASSDSSVIARPPNMFTTYRTPGWFAPVVFGVPLALIVGGAVAWRWAARQPLEKRLSDKLPPMPPLGT